MFKQTIQNSLLCISQTTLSKMYTAGFIKPMTSTCSIGTSPTLGKLSRSCIKHKFNLTGVNKLSAEKQDIGGHVIIWFD